MDFFKTAFSGVILAIGVYAAFLFYDGARRVSKGPLKELFQALLFAILCGVAYAVWNALLAAEMITANGGVHDPLIHEVPGNVAVFLFFVAMLNVAGVVKKLADQYGYSK